MSGVLVLPSNSMLNPTYVLYLEQSVVAIDNNRSERTIKPFEIGSGNQLFSNTRSERCLFH